MLEALAAVLPEQFTAVTVLIEGDINEALRRNLAKPTHSKFDNMGFEFFEKQQEVYRRLARTGNWIVVDGNESTERVHTSVTAKIVHL